MHRRIRKPLKGKKKPLTDTSLALLEDRPSPELGIKVELLLLG